MIGLDDPDAVDRELVQILAHADHDAEPIASAWPLPVLRAWAAIRREIHGARE